MQIHIGRSFSGRRAVSFRAKSQGYNNQIESLLMILFWLPAFLISLPHPLIQFRIPRQKTPFYAAPWSFKSQDKGQFDSDTIPRDPRAHALIRMISLAVTLNAFTRKNRLSALMNFSETKSSKGQNGFWVRSLYTVLWLSIAGTVAEGKLTD